MNISRVDKNAVDQQFTATDLIGKDVYDNAGQKVGQVKDIVLGSAAGSHLAMALGTSSGTSDSSGMSDHGTSGTSATSSTRRTSTGMAASTATDSGSSMASTGSASRSGAGASDTAGSWASQAQGALSGLTSEPAAIVSVGGFMGMGDNMVRVPLSQLNYDQSNQHLTVAISQSELASLTEKSGSQAAE